MDKIIPVAKMLNTFLEDIEDYQKQVRTQTKGRSGNIDLSAIFSGEEDEYNWSKAFEYAGEKDPQGNTLGSPEIEAVPGDDVDTKGFSRKDVKTILGIREGMNDEEEWVIAGQLKDGRWFLLVAGCDYTGWDCQASGYAIVASSKETLIRLGMSKEIRSALKIKTDFKEEQQCPVGKKGKYQFKLKKPF